MHKTSIMLSTIGIFFVSIATHGQNLVDSLKTLQTSLEQLQQALTPVGAEAALEALRQKIESWNTTYSQFPDTILGYEPPILYRPISWIEEYRQHKGDQAVMRYAYFYRIISEKMLDQLRDASLITLKNWKSIIQQNPEVYSDNGAGLLKLIDEELKEKQKKEEVHLITVDDAMQAKLVPLKIQIGSEGEKEIEYIYQEAPYFVEAKKLYQFTVVDQFSQIAIPLKMEPAVCGVVAAFNAAHLNASFKAERNKLIENLKVLTTQEKAQNFVKNFKEKNAQWLDEQGMQEALNKITDVSTENIGILAAGGIFYLLDKLQDQSVQMRVFQSLNINQDTANQIQIFISDEAKEKANQLFAAIKNGLKQKEFYYSCIVLADDFSYYEQTKGGTGETHWYVFSVVKNGDNIQYIILDSAPTAYHLDIKTNIKILATKEFLQDLKNNKWNIQRANLMVKYLEQLSKS